VPFQPCAGRPIFVSMGQLSFFGRVGDHVGTSSSVQTGLHVSTLGTHVDTRSIRDAIEEATGAGFADAAHDVEALHG